MKLTKFVLVVLAVLLAPTLVLTPSAFAQDVKDEARQLAQEGIRLLEEGQPDAAIAKLQEAESKFHAPTHLLYIARARTQLGQLREAHDTYISILAEKMPNYVPEAFHKARQTAEGEAAGLRPRLATVAIQISGENADQAEVAIDGEPVDAAVLPFPIAVEPGTHQITATAIGAEPASQSVDVAVGNTASVALDLAAAAAGPARGAAGGGDTVDDDGFPVIATIALAVGAVGLGVGAVTGALTLSKASDIKAECDGDRCPAAQESEADDAKTLGNVSTAMFVVGGIATTLGVVLLVIDLSSDSGGDTALQLNVTPTGAALRGSF